MSVRKTVPILLLTTVLALGGACGDRTVTSSPATSSRPFTPTSVGSATDSVDVADADLAEVDRLLRDIEADLSAVDRDASTPEGDPTQ